MTASMNPTRITIDFHDSVHPSRTWIMGIDERSPQRLELIAFDGQPESLAPTRPSLRPVPVRRQTSEHGVALLASDCSCPEFCELDHANE